MLKKLKLTRNKLVYIVLVGSLIFGLILVLTRQKGEGVSTKEYYDDICDVGFNYPKAWTKSNIILPLPQKPLFQITFDEPAQKNKTLKNSIFSFICYDATKYSFDQFIKESPFVGQIETIDIGEVKWRRVGNFVYTIQNNKLIIFEMFFTKYDLKPEAGYEDIFLNIIQSAQF